MTALRGNHVHKLSRTISLGLTKSVIAYFPRRRERSKHHSAVTGPEYVSDCGVHVFCSARLASYFVAIGVRLSLLVVVFAHLIHPQSSKRIVGTVERHGFAVLSAYEVSVLLGQSVHALFVLPFKKRRARKNLRVCCVGRVL